MEITSNQRTQLLKSIVKWRYALSAAHFVIVCLFAFKGLSIVGESNAETFTYRVERLFHAAHRLGGLSQNGLEGDLTLSVAMIAATPLFLVVFTQIYLLKSKAETFSAFDLAMGKKPFKTRLLTFLRLALPIIMILGELGIIGKYGLISGTLFSEPARYNRVFPLFFNSCGIRLAIVSAIYAQCVAVWYGVFIAVFTRTVQTLAYDETHNH